MLTWMHLYVDNTNSPSKTNNLFSKIIENPNPSSPPHTALTPLNTPHHPLNVFFQRCFSLPFLLSPPINIFNSIFKLFFSTKKCCFFSTIFIPQNFFVCVFSAFACFFVVEWGGCLFVYLLCVLLFLF
eukprot:c12909_g1_i1.p3 GENE.c12909_g1_i1~~c12909_g1_i1.p3  ORF type:complete len:128 (+),score=15.95 c12909_g1_i1:745-1128(+)